ncbi:MAG: hypothetical protein R6W99_03510 [Clostridia bacterium]
MAKKKITKFILAVKDYEKTVEMVTSGKKNMPKEASVYEEFFNNVVNKCSDFAGLKKFVRASKFSKKDCMHYWEGLMTLNFTLVIISYNKGDENFVENACDNELIKFISALR